MTQDPKSDSEIDDNPQSNNDLSGLSDDDLEGQGENEAPKIRSSPSIPNSSMAGFRCEDFITLISQGRHYIDNILLQEASLRPLKQDPAISRRWLLSKTFTASACAITSQLKLRLIPVQH